MATTSEDAPQRPILTPEEQEQVKTGARWLRRVVNPYAYLNKLATVGTAVSSTIVDTSQRPADPDVQDYLKDLTPIQRELYAEDFRQLIKRLPFIKQRLESSSEPSQTIQKILNAVQSAADSGKHDDTGAMKGSIIKLIPRKCLPDPGGDDNPKTAQSYVLDLQAPELTKAWRGFNHPLTATLLCPVDYLSAMKESPDETQMKLLERELPLIDNSGDPKLPFFLYDPDLANGSMSQGLFRGPVLLAVYLHIFISPSAAIGAKASSKRGNARIHGMTQVIPSTICYAAIQTYVALSSIEKWGEKWEDINLERLYMFLREQLTPPDDPWVTETLEWWNKKVFGDSPGAPNRRPKVRDTQGPSVRERMANERRERARAAATPTREN